MIPGSLILQSVTMASRLQDDVDGTSHYGGVKAGVVFEECDIQARVTSSDDDSYDSDSYYTSSSSESDSGSDLEVEAHCTRVSEGKADAAPTSKSSRSRPPPPKRNAGNHADVDDDYEHYDDFRHPRHHHRDPKYPPSNPAYSVAEGTVGAVGYAGKTVLDVATLNFGNALVDAVGSGAYATQAGTLGLVQAGSQADAPAAAPKAGASFMDACWVEKSGKVCTGCTHVNCKARNAGGKAAGSPMDVDQSSSSSGKRAGAGERRSSRREERVCKEHKKAGCGECGGRKKARGRRHDHSKGAYSKASGRDYSGGGEYELRGVHQKGVCVSCNERVKRAGGQCACTALKSVKIN